jgi:hypothetical protein
MGRRGTAAAAAAGTALLLMVAAGIPAASATWVTSEFSDGGSSTLDCGADAPVESSAWARAVSGSGGALLPALAGLTVSNAAPATESRSSASAALRLGNDGWSSTVDLGGLGPPPGGVTALATGTGLYTEYARATARGLSVAAAGAVTTSADGSVSLGSASSGAAQAVTLHLSEVLAPVIAGPASPVAPGELADVRISAGTLGARAEYDSCPVLWAPSALDSHLSRTYLVTDVGLRFDSQAVRTAAATTDAALAALQSELNGLQPAGTAVTGPALTGITQSLSSALDLELLGIRLGLGRVNSVKTGVTFDLSAARALLRGTITDGLVTIDLATGRVTADLAALFGEVHGTSGLNGQPPNSSVLTPEVLGELSKRIGGIVTGFVDGALSTALQTAVTSAATVVDIDADVTATVPPPLNLGAPVVHANAISLKTTMTGTLGSFLGAPGQPRPAVSAKATILAPLLSDVLAPLLSPLQSAVVTPFATTVAARVGSTVLSSVSSSALARASTATTEATRSTVPTLLSALAPALSTLADLLDVTVNAQPDQPRGADPPAPAVEGRYQVSAIQVALRGLDGARLLSISLASAAVGPNHKRPAPPLP